MAVSTLWLSLVLCIVSGSELNNEANLFELLDKASKSINQALIYLDTVKPHLTVDGLLGVIIVKEQSAQLLRMLAQVIDQHRFSTRILLVKQLLERMHWQSSQVATAIQIALRHDPPYFRAIGGILHPIIWSKVDCHLKNLNETEPQRLQSSRVKTTLNENQSDFCLSEVLNQCKMSKFCWNLLVESEYEEYPLAHQVLYLTVARSMNCINFWAMSQIRVRIENKMATLCGSMYRANLKMEQEHYPSENQDLFMQNIAFCGKNAYKPFRERYRWLIEIMSWQSSDKGCFQIDWHKLARMVSGQSLRPKRRERVFQDGCSLHKTSMALASMSIYVQQLVIEWLSLHPEFDCDHLIS